MPAIYLGPGTRAVVRDNFISGFDVGIEGAPGASVDADNNHFDRVRQPYKLPNAGPSRVAGTRITNDPKIADGSSRQGWRRAGPSLPAFCPRCKSVFPSRNYEIRSPRLSVQDNEETCPNCEYEHAKVNDGIFDLTADAVRIITASDFTYATLAALLALAGAVVEERIAPEEAVARYKAISPRLGRIAKAAFGIGGAALTFISAAIAYRSLILQQESVDIAKEQLRLQQQSNASSDHALEQTLHALSTLELTLKHPQEDGRQTKRAGPPERKSGPEPGSLKLEAQRKPKARQMRREADKARRHAFNPRPSRAESADAAPPH